MKKSLLLILASLFTVFALTGCADEEKNDTPVITQPTLSESDLKSLQGTYDIEFFYTSATVATLTNDCSKLQEYVGSKLQEYVGSDAKCSNSEMQGKGSIAVSNDNDSVKIITKVQLDGGGFNNPIVAQFAKNQKYNYTVYNDIPVSAVKDNYLNLDNVTKGTTGRNADSSASAVSKDDTYNITIENGIVIIDMIKYTGISIAETAPVVVRMKKVSDNVETLDPNTAFPTPDISNIFKADIGYNLPAGAPFPVSISNIFKADIGYNN